MDTIIKPYLRFSYKCTEGEEMDILFNWQYIGNLNDKGEQIIWINSICGCRNRKKIKKETIIVFDGGNCYWNVRVNIDTKKIFHFSVNGIS